MNGLLKNWIRRRRRSKQRRHDFSKDIRRAERRKKLQRLGPIRWMQKAFATAFRFRDPAWAQSRPLTKRDKRQTLDRGSFFNPLVWIWGLVRFIGSWLVSRPYGSMLPALPALTVMLGVLGLVVWYRSAGRNWRETMYRQQLSEAVQQKNYPIAMVSVNTLIDQNPLDAELQYQRALIASDLGQPQLCEYYMQQLAAGAHVPAIYWILGKHYNDPPVSGWKVEKQQRYRHYLTKLLKLARGQQLVTAKKLMGVYLAEMGLKSEAAERLSELAHDQPDLLLSLAMLYAETGHEQRTMEYASQAQNYLGEVLLSDPANVNTRLNLAQALLMTEAWDECIDVLQQGYQLVPDERLKNALVEACAGASLQLKNPDRLKPAVLDRRFKYAAAGLKLASDNMHVLDAIQRLLAETRDQGDVALRGTLLASLEPDTLHFVEGTLALLDNKFDDAIKHLRLAQSHGLNAAGILNNLAVALAAEEGADLQEALELAEGALEMLPENPYVLETRGQILLKLGRHEEAIRDLEKSLKGVQQLQLKNLIYPNLVKAYLGLGLDDIAAKYQLLADQTSKVLAAQRAAE